MVIKAVIFDMDGTILNTLDDVVDAVNHSLSKFGFKEYSKEDIKNAVGNGVRILMKRLVPEDVSEQVFENFLEYFIKYYSENMNNKTAPYDDIISMLEKLRADGYKIGVLSNKFDSAVKELSNKYFPNLVDVAVGQKDDVNEKPAPDGVFEVAKLLGVAVEECVYVGDSEVDIQTAQNAGIDCISVTWGFKTVDFLYKNGATRLAYIPEDICELL
ncbi:HAD-IA family hydrolase [bacterium]|nr:HAD-IA family hydrolase [bacterium]